jgi:hypothetical protein
MLADAPLGVGFEGLVRFAGTTSFFAVLSGGFFLLLTFLTMRPSSVLF